MDVQTKATDLAAYTIDNALKEKIVPKRDRWALGTRLVDTALEMATRIDTANTLRLDIRRFFDSIPHDQLKAMVSKKARCEEFRRRVDEIIDSFSDPGIGLGSQISQLLAIAYLSELDHYIKERLGVRHYLRYSDDIVMIHESKEFLQRTWTDVAGRLAALGLQLNPKSTLHPLKQGVRFLKFRFILTDTGKVVRVLDRRNIVRIRKRLRKLKNKAIRGERQWQDLINSFNSWKAHAEQGNSHERIRRLKRWLES